jgi:hypothetical protein
MPEYDPTDIVTVTFSHTIPGEGSEMIPYKLEMTLEEYTADQGSGIRICDLVEGVNPPHITAIEPAPPPN